MRGNLVQPTQADGRAKARRRQCGFSILEMVLASAIMMVGIISVVQLVPASLQLNASNRLDTTATVIAQRELDQMLSQPLTVSSFLDTDGRTISLGGANSPGAPVVMDSQGQTAQIDFTAAPVAGFSIPTYVDPNDPSGATFELRWAVISVPPGNANPISKRIIIGCRQTNSSQPSLPVNLDSWKFKGN
jgi:type II secretory pathway pseudopilin PulG